MPRQLARLVFVLISLGVLSACGFQLRDNQSIAASHQPMAVDVRQAQSPALKDALLQLLKDQGIATSSSAQARTVLQLTVMQDGRRDNAVNSAGRTSEKSHYLLAELRLLKDGEAIAPASHIKLRRIVDVDPDFPEASDREAELVAEEIYADMASAALRRSETLLKQVLQNRPQ